VIYTINFQTPLTEWEQARVVKQAVRDMRRRPYEKVHAVPIVGGWALGAMPQLTDTDKAALTTAYGVTLSVRYP
jgi:hypothetical protein